MAVLTGRARWLVPASLWLSFVANDGEEVATMPRTTSLPQRHVTVAVAVMGVLYSAAVLDGWRTRGCGWLYQDVQRVFGLHGWWHIAASVITRRYTSGVATSPLVVIPQGVWARRQLRAAGVPDTSSLPRAALVMGVCLAAAHALGHVADRRGISRRRR